LSIKVKTVPGSEVRVTEMPPVSVSVTEKGFSDANDVPTRALVDADRHVQADIVSMPPVTVTVTEKGFSDTADTPTRALVDADRHVQTDVLTVANPPNLDVALSTRASEATLNAVKAQIDKLTFDSLNRLKVLLENLPNPSNLDVALSTRASEETLSALKSALASVGTDKVRTSIVDPLPAGTNTIGSVNAVKSGTWNIDNLLNPHPVKFTPEDRITDVGQFSGTFSPSAAGSTTVIAAVSGKVIRVYDFVLWNSGAADVGVELYFGSSGKRLFKGLLAPKTGVLKSFVRPWESNAGDSLVLGLDAAGTCNYCVGAVQV